MNYLKTVKEFIVATFLFGDDDHLGNDTPLLGSGYVDSTGVLEIVGFIEATYGITIEDDELTADNFFSLEAIERFLQQKGNSRTFTERPLKIARPNENQAQQAAGW